jgi:hypothetical protein
MNRRHECPYDSSKGNYHVVKSMIAELWNLVEETHVEAPHEDVDNVPYVEKMAPSPKFFQLRDPSAVREFLVHAHGHDANLFAEVADALAQLDLCQHASIEAFVGLTIPSNCLWKCNLSMLFATFERTTIRMEYFQRREGPTTRILDVRRAHPQLRLRLQQLAALSRP